MLVLFTIYLLVLSLVGCAEFSMLFNPPAEVLLMDAAIQSDQLQSICLWCFRLFHYLMKPGENEPFKCRYSISKCAIWNGVATKWQSARLCQFDVTALIINRGKCSYFSTKSLTCWKQIAIIVRKFVCTATNQSYSFFVYWLRAIYMKYICFSSFVFDDDKMHNFFPVSLQLNVDWRCAIVAAQQIVVVNLVNRRLSQRIIEIQSKWSAFQWMLNMFDAAVISPLEVPFGYVSTRKQWQFYLSDCCCWHFPLAVAILIPVCIVASFFPRVNTLMGRFVYT